MARAAGCKVYNFSKGGMTAEAYCKTFADDNGLWDKNKAGQAYVIALGVNDLTANKTIGTTADICLDDYTKKRRYRHRLVRENYSALQNRFARREILFVTLPRNDKTDESSVKVRARYAEFNRILREFTEIFDNSYVIDLEKYFPVMDDEYRKNFYLGGHLNPMGYILTAKVISSYIDYIVRHNYKDFKQVGFIGTPYKNTADK
ncbi:MAG: SGNH/GDSL hydrolase family protein [Clostridiales bacterium]|nr:MAG: SGNH/GDSL hydrolase family protein [Clostridiales bacterium]